MSRRDKDIENLLAENLLTRPRKGTMKTTFGGARFAGGLRAPLGGAARLLIALGVAAIVATVPAVAGTLTLTWTGGSWNDGGSFSGTFTVTYNDLTGAPTALVSADIITGNGTNGDGFAGQTYLYSVPGYADTVSSSGFDAIQASGSPANELTLSETGGFYYMYLDWQGTSPTTLWVGSAGGQYSSEGFKASGPGGLWSAVRYLNSEGGSAGTSAPEPATLILTGLALVGAVSFRHRKPSGPQAY